MAVRNRFLIRILGWLIAQFCRLWLCTLKVHVEHAQAEVDPHHPQKGRIFSLWHEDMLYLGYLFAGLGITVLISQSNDGELISRVMETLGFKTVRGSSNRGGMRAVREIIQNLAGYDVAITPDGPRGPRREVQQGAVYVASRSEMPLVPIGLAYERPWRMNSWDHLVLPRPFSKVVVCFGAPLTVPSDANAESRERHRNQLAALMSEGCGRAENLLRRWRKGEKLPLVSPEAKALQATPLRQTA